MKDSQLARQPDAVLVARGRDGSESAFAEIVRRYERPLQAYCSRILDAALAKDAVQQTFLRTLAALRNETTGDLVLRPWLYRVAHRCALDIRRRDKVTLVELDRSLDGVAQPQQLFELHERLDGMVAAMRKLPASQRRALVARELEGRSYNEISDELDQSDAGVRQLIFRARNALRNGLGAILPVFTLRRWPQAAGQLSAATGWHDAILARSTAVVLAAGCVTLGIVDIGSGPLASGAGVAQRQSRGVAGGVDGRPSQVTLVALRTRAPTALANHTNLRPRRAVVTRTETVAPPLAADENVPALPGAGGPSAPLAAPPAATAVEAAAQAPDPSQVAPTGYVAPPSGDAAGSPASAPASEPPSAPSGSSTAPNDSSPPASRNPHTGGPPPGRGPQAPSEPRAGGESNAAPGHSGIARGGSGANPGNPGLHAGQLAQSTGAAQPGSRPAGSSSGA